MIFFLVWNVEKGVQMGEINLKTSFPTKKKSMP
jgi:hypothetical protein